MESNDVDGVDKNSDADGNHDYHDMDNSNEDNYHYYSTVMSFYHIWSRERAKYETVIHCSVPV